MRQAVFLALAALPLAAAPAAPPASAPAAASPARCLEPGVTFARTRPTANRLQKLGELPPANHYLAVVRNVGGCPAPAIVRTGIGGRR